MCIYALSLVSVLACLLGPCFLLLLQEVVLAVSLVVHFYIYSVPEPHPFATLISCIAYQNKGATLNV
jgi:hypothetical protein